MVLLLCHNLLLMMLELVLNYSSRRRLWGEEPYNKLYKTLINDKVNCSIPISIFVIQIFVGMAREHLP